MHHKRKRRSGGSKCYPCSKFARTNQSRDVLGPEVDFSSTDFKLASDIVLRRLPKNSDFLDEEGSMSVVRPCWQVEKRSKTATPVFGGVLQRCANFLRSILRVVRLKLQGERKPAALEFSSESNRKSLMSSRQSLNECDGSSELEEIGAAIEGSWKAKELPPPWHAQTPCSTEHKDQPDNQAELRSMKTAESGGSCHFLWNHLYIVADVDTMLNGLHFINGLSKTRVPDSVGTIIYIPFCVLQRLRHLATNEANSRHEKAKAVLALEYIQSGGPSSVRFQVQNESIACGSNGSKGSFTADNDRVIQAYLQAQEHARTILFTKEKALIRKAKQQNITVANENDL